MGRRLAGHIRHAIERRCTAYTEAALRYPHGLAQSESRPRSARRQPQEMHEKGGDGRGDRIRTCDILLPKQARYRTAPLPDGVVA